MPRAHGDAGDIADSLLAGADDAQRAMMEEEVILTNYYDDPIGKGSKKDSEWRAQGV
jgi:hypothetical protein